MRSSLPKVLHPVAGKPMLTRILDGLAHAGFARPYVVVGAEQDAIRAAIGDRCVYVDQREQLGTGHAARVALECLPPSVKRVLLVHGDEPLIEQYVYHRMFEIQSETGAPVVLLTVDASDTRGFGRVLRDAGDHPIALLQEADLTSEQQALHEVNIGAYVFDVDFLRAHLHRLQPHPPKGEYYLTDVVALAATENPGGRPVEALKLDEGEAIMGANDLVQLEQVGRVIYQRTNRRLMLSGVTIIDSASTFIDDAAEIAPDTVIYPFTIIEGRTRIGANCRIGPSSHIAASEIGDGCTVLSSTVEDSSIGRNVRVGPYAHLRQQAQVGDGAVIGNYAEIKNSTLGPGVRMHHMSYVGDAKVGREVNISAGVITCNYDGKAKHRTVIEDGAFVGSDTMLRAPVTIGKGAFTGAGSVVTRDVAPGATVAGVPARVLRAADDATDQET